MKSWLYIAAFHMGHGDDDFINLRTVLVKAETLSGALSEGWKAIDKEGVIAQDDAIPLEGKC